MFDLGQISVDFENEYFSKVSGCYNNLLNLIHLPKMIKAMSKGFLPGKLEGDKALMPADFLIDEDGTILTAFYGKNLGDHLPISKIEEWLTGSIKKKAG